VVYCHPHGAEKNHCLQRKFTGG